MSEACVYLGSLSIREIEEMHGFRFTDEESEYLKATQHHKARFKDGETGWHMFDLPPFLAISNGSVGNKALSIFSSHNHEFAFAFPAGYANAFEEAGSDD